jgi:Asp-tRNA(Asn)/Glu-tRNA(Gln) amidotransferase A subunit family amidase
LAGQPGLARGIKNFGHRDTWHYWQVVEAQMEYQRRFAQALDHDDGGPFDLILCPATALPAWTHGAGQNLVLAGAYTALYNVLGYPAGVVPVTRVRAGEEIGRKPSRDLVQQAAYNVEQGSAGLPIGVQVAARPWREHVALAAMRAIEDAARTQSDFPAQPPIG